ncbi:MAG: DciA family protein [Nitrospirota bacterium]
MKRVDSLLIPFVRELGIEDGVRLAKIKMNWHNLFNKPLSYHMSPYMLSGDEIVLNVDSHLWLQELNFYKEDIIKKLSAYSVKAVRFRLGTLMTSTSRGRVSKKSEVTSQKSQVRRFTHEELSYIEDTISKINEPELRETVRRTIQKALISRRIRQ